jgi:DNA-binding NtrC family response regulator
MNLQILFVDTESQLLETYRKYFSRLGFKVDCATRQEQAAAMVAKNRYAAVISELKLGSSPDDCQGIELAWTTRGLRPGTAFILLTASFSRDLERTARSAGVFSCLWKPKPLSAINEEILLAVDPAKLAQKAIA